MTNRILAIGEILWDMLPTGKQLGGAPTNFACRASALGAQVRLVSRVGNDDLGREILAEIARRKLPVDTIGVDRAAPTGTVTVDMHADGSHCFTIHRHVAWDYLVADELSLAAASYADAVYFGSLGQRSSQSRQACRRLLEASRPDALRVFDINLRQDSYTPELIEESLERANVLKINDDELSTLGGMLGCTGTTATRLESLAARYSLLLVALTRGSHGSLLYSHGRFSEHPGIQVDVRDTIGAGDAFTAVVTLGLLSGWELDAINQQANVVAAQVCSQAGAIARIPEELGNCAELAVS